MVHDDHMGYEVTRCDGESELVLAADGYQQEGPLTTFFRSEAGRPVLDSWSVRVASYRTTDISRIRRLEVVDAALVDAAMRDTAIVGEAA
jgi:hypothetical protein